MNFSQHAANVAQDPVQALADAIREATHAFAQQKGFDWSLVIALLAVIVSAISLFITHRMSRETIRQSAATEFGKLELSYRRRQLNLYGKIHILNRASKLLHDKLIEGKQPGWHFLEHVDEVLGNKVDRRLMEEILIVNKRIGKLLENNAGLLEDVARSPASFDAFLRHHRLVESAMSGSALPAIKNADTFPPDFDSNILDACKHVTSSVAQILANSSPIIRKGRVGK